MADALLTGRGQDPPLSPVGKNWVPRFVSNKYEL